MLTILTIIRMIMVMILMNMTIMMSTLILSELDVPDSHMPIIIITLILTHGGVGRIITTIHTITMVSI